MAFKDIEILLYNDTVKLTYTDSSHRYGVSFLQEDGSWSKPKRPASVTGAKDDTLEKKGLMTWPMGLALRHLFGYYNFKNDRGERVEGFSTGVGVLWDVEFSKENVISHLGDAQSAWQKKQKQGADIGSLVHDAVEQYINGTPFEITVERYGRGLVFDNEAQQAEWEEKAPEEVAMANVAFESFKTYWAQLNARVISAEQIVYSKRMNLAGTYDYDLDIPGRGNVLADLKTTKASVAAGAPMGVYYDFFVQLGIYAAIKVEMGHSVPDDLAIFSARKEGGFDAVYASDVGLTVQECMDWGEAVVTCYNMMKRTKKALTVLAGSADKPDDE